MRAFEFNSVVALHTEVGQRSFKDSFGLAFVRIMAGEAVAFFSGIMDHGFVAAGFLGFVALFTERGSAFFESQRSHFTMWFVTSQTIAFGRWGMGMGSFVLRGFMAIKTRALFAEAGTFLDLCIAGGHRSEQEQQAKHGDHEGAA
jgi:hypothetical protein